jgi:hypothetical protein
MPAAAIDGIVLAAGRVVLENRTDCEFETGFDEPVSN